MGGRERWLTRSLVPSAPAHPDHSDNDEHARRTHLGRDADGTDVSERQLSDAVAELAQLLGWRGYHTYDSRRSAAGFPDWVFVHPKQRRLLMVELKAARGKLSMEQVEWLDTLTDSECCEVACWYPADWTDGTVEAVLRGESNPAV